VLSARSRGLVRARPRDGPRGLGTDYADGEIGAAATVAAAASLPLRKILAALTPPADKPCLARVPTRGGPSGSVCVLRAPARRSGRLHQHEFASVDA